MPALIPLAVAAATAGGAVVAAKIKSGSDTEAAQTQAGASLKAADISSQTAANALAFQKQQAAQDLATQNAIQKANYEQTRAKQQRISDFGQMLGLPAQNIPDYVPIPGASTVPTSTTTLPGQAPSGAVSAAMPQGIDPRFAQVYQQAGVTPGPRGSGPADWAYYQNDAVKNAGGDVNYVLGRLAADLKGGGSSASGAAPTATAAAPANSFASMMPQVSPYASPVAPMPQGAAWQQTPSSFAGVLGTL